MSDNNCIGNPFSDLYEKRICDMTASDFEEYSFEILKALAEKEGLSNFTISHDEKITASDGTYQIDVYASYTALNCTFKVLAECKKYKKSVERKVVAELQAKLNSIGAQKGIVISSAGFQKGAVEYAKAHGIALIQIFDKYLRFVSNSANSDMEKRNSIMYQCYPDYYAMTIDEHGIPEETIYPTENMRKEIALKAQAEWEKYKQNHGDNNA